MIVLDASVAAKLVLLDEADADKAAALVGDCINRGEPLVAPPLLRSEITNILRQRTRRTGMPLATARALLADFLSLSIGNTEPGGLYDRALQINPASSLAALEKGRIQLEQGQTDDAVDSLSRTLEVDPHSFDAYMLLSSAYEKMGHIKEAIAAVDEAQRIRADAPEIKSTMDRLNARKDSK